MRTMITSILIPVLWAGFTGAFAQLPPEIMVDSYLVRAERLLAAKDYGAALNMMAKIVALQKEHDLRLPEEFPFKYARVALSAGSIEVALESVNRYLVAAGRGGEFYRPALELLDEVQQIQTKAAQIQAKAEEHLVRAERLLAAKDYGAALNMMAKIVALQKEHDLRLPEEFPFKYARVMLSEGQAQGNAGMIRTVMGSMKKYLAAAGDAGEFHEAALELLDEAKQQSLPLKPEMVVIPAGRFRMGCVSGRDCINDEQPVHKVRVGSFALSKYEVTFEEYDRFTMATGRERADSWHWGRGRRPVIWLLWEDAVAYTAWLSEATGERYRLPSEAEWEYAARAGTETAYSWGNEIDHNRANCDGCGGQWDREKEGTAPVGSFGANAWGLHDMHGNVSEWVQDCYHASYRGGPADGSAWESGDCSQRVLRGGSWIDRPRDLRSALRDWNSTGNRIIISGFRVARTVTP